MENTQSRDKSFTQNALLANPCDPPFDPRFQCCMYRKPHALADLENQTIIPNIETGGLERVWAKQFDTAFVSKIAVWVETFVTAMGKFLHSISFFMQIRLDQNACASKFFHVRSDFISNPCYVVLLQ